MENFCSEEDTNEREVVLDERADSSRDGQDVEEDSNDPEIAYGGSTVNETIERNDHQSQLSSRAGRTLRRPARFNDYQLEID